MEMTTGGSTDFRSSCVHTVQPDVSVYFSAKLKTFLSLLQMGKQPPFYAVARGRKCGVFRNWEECKEQVSGYPSAVFKKFATKEEASEFLLTSGNPRSGGHQPSQGLVSKPPQKGMVQRHRTPIYIDGASRGNGKQTMPISGFGVYFGKGDPRNKAIGLHQVDDIRKDKPTNQRAELHALKHALKYVDENPTPEGYEIFTDSMYSKKCIETWAQNWQRNGWKNSSGQPVANKSLIMDTLELYKNVKKRYQDKFALTHVKGHLGIEGNEAADQLANKGADLMAQHIS